MSIQRTDSSAETLLDGASKILRCIVVHRENADGGRATSTDIGLTYMQRMSSIAAKTVITTRHLPGSSLIPLMFAFTPVAALHHRTL